MLKISITSVFLLSFTLHFDVSKDLKELNFGEINQLISLLLFGYYFKFIFDCNYIYLNSYTLFTVSHMVCLYIFQFTNIVSSHISIISCWNGNRTSNWYSLDWCIVVCKISDWHVKIENYWNCFWMQDQRNLQDWQILLKYFMMQICNNGIAWLSTKIFQLHYNTKVFDRISHCYNASHILKGYKYWFTW